MNNELFLTLEKRFKENMHRHPSVTWDEVKEKLLFNQKVLKTLQLMEETNGEPDVVSFDGKTLSFVDFAKESPLGRRSLCYDKEALDKRKTNKPSGNVVDEAEKMGIALLNEKEYKHIQAIEPLDLKTSSWIVTPPEIRKLGGAIFGDCRYQHVFIYHNGADSYYGARGFRGRLDLV